MEFPDTATGLVLGKWKAAGFDLRKELKVEFFAAAPDEESGKRIAELATKSGFGASVEFTEFTVGGVRKGRWTCYCTKILIPTYQTIVEHEQAVDEIARQFGGYGDGFGSFGNLPRN